MRLLIFLAFLALVALAACSPANTGDTKMPPGDASRGAELFTQAVGGAPACSTCHTLDGSTLVGPSLQGYASVGPTRMEGMSAEEYTQASIVRPAAYIVSGFANTMYNQFQQHLTSQNIADLVAYLLTL
jgi:mono/diheme cytochrome c family protein